jgi:hypothetical protein
MSARIGVFAVTLGAALAATANPAWAEEDAPRDDAPRAEAPRDDAAPVEVPRVTSFRAGVEAGGFTQRFLVLPVHGLDVSGALGLERVGSTGAINGWALDFRLGYTSGDTPAGLRTRSYRFGPEVALVDGRARFGIGVHVADVGYLRVTNGALANDFVFGGSAFLTVDLLSFDQHALYLGLRGNYDSDGSSLDVYDVGLNLGLRL